MRTAGKGEVGKTAGDAIEIHESVHFKMKGIGRRKPALEGKGGDDLQKSTGKWMKLERSIDSEHDKYREVVIDPETGRIVHYCEEPLSQHQGHGSAKRRTQRRSNVAPKAT